MSTPINTDRNYLVDCVYRAACRGFTEAEALLACLSWLRGGDRLEVIGRDLDAWLKENGVPTWASLRRWAEGQQIESAIAATAVLATIQSEDDRGKVIADAVAEGKELELRIQAMKACNPKNEETGI